MDAISLLSLDVGFDLRATKHPVHLPQLPFRLTYARDNRRDDCVIVAQDCDTPEDVSQLRADLTAAGYVVYDPAPALAREAIAKTAGHENREQAAIAWLHQSGCMAGRTCGEQQGIEAEVRRQLLAAVEA